MISAPCALLWSISISRNLSSSSSSNCRSSASSVKRCSSSRIPPLSRSGSHTRSVVERKRVSATSTQGTCVCAVAQWLQSLEICLVHWRLLLSAMTWRLALAEDLLAHRKPVHVMNLHLAGDLSRLHLRNLSLLDRESIDVSVDGLCCDTSNNFFTDCERSCR